MFPLVNLTKVSMAAHPMYFQVSVPTRISTDPGHGTRISWPLLLPNIMEDRSLLVVCYFTEALSGPPWD